MGVSDRPGYGPAGLEKGLLLVPVVASGVFGLILLLAPAFGAAVLGLPGNDHYIYRLAGAAAFGYTVALLLGIASDDWVALRLPVLATFVFSLASIYACGIEIAGGDAESLVYVVLLAATASALISGALLYGQSDIARSGPDAPTWVIYFLWIATALALVFGLVPLLFPVEFGRFFALQATDAFAYRHAGAATLGYGIMGLFELRSRSWTEMRLPIAMAAVFNGLSFLASLVAIYNGEGVLLAYLVALASMGITVAAVVALLRRGA